eukprot:478281-Heterocapsa_arctica.AAC.1
MKQIIPSAVIVAIGENAGSMKQSMKEYASDVLDWPINHFQVKNSGNFAFSRRNRLWYTNLASGAEDPDFNPEDRVEKGWWPK